MAIGQPSGPPASAQQVRELLALLNTAGHTDFRDARGPMGFTQRQAGGKFTRDEAATFITQLLDEQYSPTTAVSAPLANVSAPRAPTARQKTLRSASSESLAAELQSRGWVVMEP